MKVSLPYGKGTIDVKVPDGTTVAYPGEPSRVPDVAAGIGRQDLEAMFFQYASSPQEAVNRAVELAGGDPSVLVLPYAVDCVPKIVAA